VEAVTTTPHSLNWGRLPESRSSTRIWLPHLLLLHWHPIQIRCSTVWLGLVVISVTCRSSTSTDGAHCNCVNSVQMVAHFPQEVTVEDAAALMSLPESHAAELLDTLHHQWHVVTKDYRHGSLYRQVT
jgi:hypothetical protein